MYMPDMYMPFRDHSDYFATLSEIAEAGRCTLPADVLDFLERGAGEERTLRDNLEAFHR
jgi:hypothetical protein